MQFLSLHDANFNDVQNLIQSQREPTGFVYNTDFPLGVDCDGE